MTDMKTEPKLFYKHCMKCGMDFQSPELNLVDYMFRRHIHEEH